MLKAIGFDLWETLITDPPDISSKQEAHRLLRIEKILAARGYGRTAARIHEAHREAWHTCSDLYWSKDLDIPTRTQIVHFLESLGLAPGSFSEAALDELEHAYASAALEIPPALVEDAAETLRALKRRGLLVGLVSNTGRTPGSVLREVLLHLGLAASIDVMVFSNEHGECKPKVSIFERLRRELDVAWDEMLFVGDNPWADVHGAQQCGMKAILYLPAKRGLAVAPPVTADYDSAPDATVTRLSEIPPLLERLAT